MGRRGMAVQAQGVIVRSKDDLRLEELMVGLPGPGEVLVRILASGVCLLLHR